MSTAREIATLQRDVGELLAERDRGRPLEEFGTWADDPAGFITRAGREPTDYQRQIVESVRDNRFTVVRGCHGAGKEWTAGAVAVWAAYCRRMLVLVVSATERQVLGQTMREVRQAWRAVPDLPGQLFTGSVRIDGEDRIIALTGGSSIDALTGWHDPAGVLVIISEGQGEKLEDAAYDAAIACATDERSRVLAMGNPVRPSGRFYDINRKPHWNAIRVSVFDTPNVKAGRTVAPGFPAANWPEEVEREYGGDSPYYIARCLAEFPETAIDGLISERAWVDEAVRKWETGELSYEAQLRSPMLVLDVSRYGADACVLGESQAPVLQRFDVWRGASLTDTANKVRARWSALGGRASRDPFGQSEGRWIEIVVDEVGVGSGVVDTLRAHKLSVTAFNGASTPRNAARFANVRSEAHWLVREALRLGTWAIPNDPLLIEELMAVTWTTNGQGRIQIEPKDDIRAKIGRSPDRLDVLTMTVWAADDGGRVSVIRFKV
jgi:hypothetical protein